MDAILNVKILGYIVVIIGIWVALLSFYLIKSIGHYRKLAKGTTGISLDKLLENILKNQEANAKQISQLAKEGVWQQKKAQNYIQKFALIRFNPFEDAGGDQSFAVALLDGAGSGVVISSLHARGNTRIYAKPVVSGKPQAHQFSKEEKEAVEKALRTQSKIGV